MDIIVNWPDFMARHDLVWESLPGRWEEAPYLGNGNVGSMIYQDGENNSLRFQIFRVDVQDHRDNTDGWTAYSRPRFMVGSFYLKPVGVLRNCQWRLDLWNAELTGTITTDRGTIRIRHLVHALDMAVITELVPDQGEKDFVWCWEPGKAITTRSGIPQNPEDIEDFAQRYGQHYQKTLKVYEPNPPVRIERTEDMETSVQDILAGGQYAIAWKEISYDTNTQLHIAAVSKSYPQRIAENEAVDMVKSISENCLTFWMQEHRDWWNSYYQASFISIPDIGLESFYWQQIYKMACATRADCPMMDTAGPWIQPTPWPYITWDLNVQLCYWPVYTSNRLHLGESLINTLHENRQTLVDNVRPVEWQEDSAYIAVTTAQDLIEPRDGDMRYWDCVGNLPWTLHNCWLHYRYSMDDKMLKDKIFPLLKRSINFYRHLLEEGEDNELNLSPTYSPETGVYPNCNYDLALLRWGCWALLEACKRLNMDDPLIPVWGDILERLTDFPTDENGFMLGQNAPFNLSHRHYSHLLMIYPLYLVNIEQVNGREAIERSLQHWIGSQGGLAGYSYTGASSIAAALGMGNEALDYLKGLERYLQPNGLYKEAGPVMETPLSAAQCIHDMLIQSWGETIRIFPAIPETWKEVSFHNLRTEGAFLVSAIRSQGENQWIRVESLSGEGCRIRPNMTKIGEVKGARDIELKSLSEGVYSLDLRKGEAVDIFSAKSPS